MGVIMACGGCGNNADMVKALYPIAAENNNLPTWTSFDVEGNPTNTGDGYRMGYWAGAGFSQNMCAMTHVMGGPNDVANMETSSGCTSQHLRLNKNGQRFMNEDTNVSDCELAFDRQPKKKARRCPGMPRRSKWTQASALTCSPTITAWSTWMFLTVRMPCAWLRPMETMLWGPSIT